MRDEVDELVEAWARERGDLDLAPVEVFSRISRLARHLDRVAGRRFAAHGSRCGSSTCSPRCAGRRAVRVLPRSTAP